MLLLRIIVRLLTLRSCGTSREGGDESSGHHDGGPTSSPVHHEGKSVCKQEVVIRIGLVEL